MASLAVMLTSASGCAVSQKTVVKPSQVPTQLQTATKEQLLDAYDRQAQAIQSLNAGVTMKLTAGSAYSGVIEQYHEVNGFILAARPASIRVIGQAPVVGKNIFDMVSDGSTFSIYIPSKNKFIGRPSQSGATRRETDRKSPAATSAGRALLGPSSPRARQFCTKKRTKEHRRFYILTIVRSVAPQSAAGSGEPATNWEIARKIWFDRADLRVSRIENFASGGKVASDVAYAIWQTTAAASYPWQINVTRPSDDYQLQITIKKLTVNETIALRPLLPAAAARHGFGQPRRK